MTVAPPICMVCHTAMSFIYKDVTKGKTVYKCYVCGYREEEYDQDGIERVKPVEQQDS